MSADPAAPAVVVIGASSGIGLACAARLAASGFRVFAGVRDPAAAARVAELTGGRAHPLQGLDITSAPALAHAAAEVEAAVGSAGLAALVNSAGTALWGPLELVELGDLRRELEVNVVGAVAAAQAFLPLLRRGRGCAVFVGSVSGRCALPYTGAYAAGKHALEAVADALRLELQASGVRVVIVEPGRIDTPLWAKIADGIARVRKSLTPASAARYADALDFAARGAAGGGGLEPDAVASTVVRAIGERRPRARYLIGNDARRLLALSRLPARLRDRLLLRRIPGGSHGAVRG
jgi:NAD(P)-dependent dehydrogenase (short-subunit alcohol dehydrogenase family)